METNSTDSGAHLDATKVVHAVCSHDCPDSCGVLVTVDQLTGRAVKVQGDPSHPVTRGFLCGKVAKYLERVYSPDRLLYPMRRKKGAPKGPAGYGGVRGREADAFERITWNEALDEVAARLTKISAEFGPRVCCRTAMPERLGSWGTGRWIGGSFIGWGPRSWRVRSVPRRGGVALKSVYGVKLGTVPQDFAHAGLVIAWGANIHGNNVHLWPFIEEARRRGARLVVIDPYRTRTAALADEHLAINPGTDAALALGMMHVILSMGLEDP